MKDLLMIMSVKKLYLVGAMLLTPPLSYAMEQDRFPQLPSDLKKKILSYCIVDGMNALVDIKRLVRVNRRWHDLINNESIIKFIIKEIVNDSLNKEDSLITETFVAQRLRNMPIMQTERLQEWQALLVKNDVLAPKLKKAIENSDLKTISSLLKEGYDPNHFIISDHKISGLCRPITYALCRKKEDCFKLLLDNGADIEGRSVGYITPLQAAAYFNCIDSLTFLLMKKININDVNDALVSAGTKGHKDSVEKLLKAGANPNSWQEYGIPLLDIVQKRERAADPETDFDHTVFFSKHENYEDLRDIRILLEHYGALGAKDYKQLIKASEDGNVATITALVKKRININALEKESNGTPLMLAAYHGQCEVVDLLLANGARIDIRDRRGCTALFWAIGNTCNVPRVNKKDREKVIEKLLLGGANPNLKDEDDEFILDIARERQMRSVIVLLERYGALGSKEYEALMIAAQNGDLRCIKSLIKKKININAQEKRSGDTPLMRATYHGRGKAVKLLLDNGALVSIKNRCQTALDKASAEREDIQEMLLLLGAKSKRKK